MKQQHKDIYHGKICPYCLKASVYIDSSIIYRGKSYGMIYACLDCDAYVGVHKGTDKALGRLANAELREWKKKAHDSFDRIWKRKYSKRKKAYQWLGEKLGIPKEYLHIGMFSVDTCKKVVELCDKWVSDYEKLEREQKQFKHEAR